MSPDHSRRGMCARFRGERVCILFGVVAVLDDLGLAELVMTIAGLTAIGASCSVSY
jgi:hypothetical protein